MSKCNCFEQSLKNIDAKIREQIPDNVQDVSIDWDNRVFMFSGGDHCPVSHQVKLEYRKVKRNGDPARSMTKDSISILPSYCPFCGREYQGNGGEA